MKKELLEQLIRRCIREVLEIAPVVGAGLHEAETVGMPAPPEGGQGTADQPAIPQPELGVPPTMPGSQGVFFVNPKLPTNRPEKKVIRPLPDAQLERELHKMASKVVGPQVRVAANTLRSVKNNIQNPAIPVFLYIGKQDPDSPELYLLADKTAQGARVSSVTPEEATTDYTSYSLPTPDPTTPQDYQARGQAAGKTVAPSIDEENKFQNMIVSMVRESLSELKK